MVTLSKEDVSTVNKAFSNVFTICSMAGTSMKFCDGTQSAIMGYHRQTVPVLFPMPTYIFPSGSTNVPHLGWKTQIFILPSPTVRAAQTFSAKAKRPSGLGASFSVV